MESRKYFSQKQATSKFDVVKQYATGGFFKAQSPVDKEVITDSFSRLSQGRVTPADMLILRDFFARAESAYAARNAQVIPNQPVRNAVNFPRTNQLQGTTGNGGGIIQAQLAEMLQKNKANFRPVIKNFLKD